MLQPNTCVCASLASMLLSLGWVGLAAAQEAAPPVVTEPATTEPVATVLAEAAPAEPIAAKQLKAIFIDVKGKVRWRQGAAAPWQEAKLNTLVDPGAEVRTGFDSRAALRVGKNATVLIDSGSSFSMPQVEQEDNFLRTIAAVQRGRAEFKVDHVEDTDAAGGKIALENDFRVVTPGTTLAVRGTEFTAAHGSLSGTEVIGSASNAIKAIEVKYVASQAAYFMSGGGETKTSEAQSDPVKQAWSESVGPPPVAAMLMDAGQQENAAATNNAATENTTTTQVAGVAASQQADSTGDQVQDMAEAGAARADVWEGWMTAWAADDEAIAARDQAMDARGAALAQHADVALQLAATQEALAAAESSLAAALAQYQSALDHAASSGAAADSAFGQVTVRGDTTELVQAAFDQADLASADAVDAAASADAAHDSQLTADAARLAVHGAADQFRAALQTLDGQAMLADANVAEAIVALEAALTALNTVEAVAAERPHPWIIAQLESALLAAQGALEKTEHANQMSADAAQAAAEVSALDGGITSSEADADSAVDAAAQAALEALETALSAALASEVAQQRAADGADGVNALELMAGAVDVVGESSVAALAARQDALAARGSAEQSVASHEVALGEAQVSQGESSDAASQAAQAADNGAFAADLAIGGSADAGAVAAQLVSRFELAAPVAAQLAGMASVDGLSGAAIGQAQSATSGSVVAAGYLTLGADIFSQLAGIARWEADSQYARAEGEAALADAAANLSAGYLQDMAAALAAVDQAAAGADAAHGESVAAIETAQLQLQNATDAVALYGSVAADAALAWGQSQVAAAIALDADSAALAIASANDAAAALALSLATDFLATRAAADAAAADTASAASSSAEANGYAQGASDGTAAAVDAVVAAGGGPSAVGDNLVADMSARQTDAIGLADESAQVRLEHIELLTDVQTESTAGLQARAAADAESAFLNGTSTGTGAFVSAQDTAFSEFITNGLDGDAAALETLLLGEGGLSASVLMNLDEQVIARAAEIAAQAELAQFHADGVYEPGALLDQSRSAFEQWQAALAAMGQTASDADGLLAEMAEFEAALRGVVAVAQQVRASLQPDHPGLPGLDASIAQLTAALVDFDQALAMRSTVADLSTSVAALTAGFDSRRQLIESLALQLDGDAVAAAALALAAADTESAAVSAQNAFDDTISELLATRQSQEAARLAMEGAQASLQAMDDGQGGGLFADFAAAISAGESILDEVTLQRDLTLAAADQAADFAAAALAAQTLAEQFRDGVIADVGQGLIEESFGGVGSTHGSALDASAASDGAAGAEQDALTALQLILAAEPGAVDLFNASEALYAELLIRLDEVNQAAADAALNSGDASGSATAAAQAAAALALLQHGSLLAPMAAGIADQIATRAILHRDAAAAALADAQLLADSAATMGERLVFGQIANIAAEAVQIHQAALDSALAAAAAAQAAQDAEIAAALSVDDLPLGAIGLDIVTATELAATDAAGAAEAAAAAELAHDEVAAGIDASASTAVESLSAAQAESALLSGSATGTGAFVSAQDAALQEFISNGLDGDVTELDSTLFGDDGTGGLAGAVASPMQVEVTDRAAEIQAQADGAAAEDNAVNGAEGLLVAAIANLIQWQAQLTTLQSAATDAADFQVQADQVAAMVAELAGVMQEIRDGIDADHPAAAPIEAALLALAQSSSALETVAVLHADIDSASESAADGAGDLAARQSALEILGAQIGSDAAAALGLALAAADTESAAAEAQSAFDSAITGMMRARTYEDEARVALEGAQAALLAIDDQQGGGELNVLAAAVIHGESALSQVNEQRDIAQVAALAGDAYADHAAVMESNALHFLQETIAQVEAKDALKAWDAADASVAAAESAFDDATRAGAEAQIASDAASAAQLLAASTGPTEAAANAALAAVDANTVSAGEFAAAAGVASSASGVESAGASLAATLLASLAHGSNLATDAAAVAQQVALRADTHRANAAAVYAQAQVMSASAHTMADRFVFRQIAESAAQAVNWHAAAVISRGLADGSAARAGDWADAAVQQLQLLPGDGTDPRDG